MLFRQNWEQAERDTVCSLHGSGEEIQYNQGFMVYLEQENKKYY